MVWRYKFPTNLCIGRIKNYTTKAQHEIKLREGLNFDSKCAHTLRGSCHMSNLMSNVILDRFFSIVGTRRNMLNQNLHIAIL